MKTAKQQSKPVIHRTFWILPHNYSCGGYYIAEKLPPVGPNGVGYIKEGVEYTDGLCFWLLSGRMEVLSEHQVRNRIEVCRDRGEIIEEVWVSALPAGARWLNIRGY